MKNQQIINKTKRKNNNQGQAYQNKIIINNMKSKNEKKIATAQPEK